MKTHQRLFHHAANLAMLAVLFLLARYEVVGRDKVPRKGSLVVVANHQSMIDPPLLAASLPRPVVFMAKRELSQAPFLGFFVQLYGAIMVRRGEADRRALRDARRVIAEGGVLGVFPEGTRSRSAQLLPGRDGAAHLASSSGATLLPVGIIGTKNVKGLRSLLRRPRIVVTVGEPFSLPKATGRIAGRDLPAMTEDVMLRIAALLPESHWGHYREKMARPNAQESHLS